MIKHGTFDTYEVIAITVPGVLVALLLSIESTQFLSLLGKDGITVGGFGLFTLLAFVLGHLVQSLGNFLETVFWLPKGMPTNWVRSDRQTLITASQRRILEERIATLERHEGPLEKQSNEDWQNVVRRLYGLVRNAERAGRIDRANRIYGLSRGLASALAVWEAWYMIEHRDEWETIAVVAVLFVSAILRMRRAAVDYARALYQEFIDLPN